MELIVLAFYYVGPWKVSSGLQASAFFTEPSHLPLTWCVHLREVKISMDAHTTAMASSLDVGTNVRGFVMITESEASSKFRCDKTVPLSLISY